MSMSLWKSWHFVLWEYIKRKSYTLLTSLCSLLFLILFAWNKITYVPVPMLRCSFLLPHRSSYHLDLNYLLKKKLGTLNQNSIICKLWHTHIYRHRQLTPMHPTRSCSDSPTRSRPKLPSYNRTSYGKVIITISLQLRFRTMNAMSKVI